MPPNNHTRDFMSHPFEKAIAGNYAAALLEGLAKGGSLLERFGLGVDGSRRAYCHAPIY
jgi:hypothetical protein